MSKRSFDDVVGELFLNQPEGEGLSSNAPKWLKTKPSEPLPGLNASPELHRLELGLQR
jgi:hypothetical protein